jgi:cobalt/nickel transport system permease protein
MRRLLIIGGIVAVLLAAVVSFYASPQPDGLNRVVEDLGIAKSEERSAVAGSVLADYSVSGVADERAGTAMAGLAGLAVTAVVGFGLFTLIRVRRS